MHAAFCLEHLASLSSVLRSAAHEASSCRAQARALLPVDHPKARADLRRRRRERSRTRDEVIADRLAHRALRAAAAPTGTARHALHVLASEHGRRARIAALMLAFLRGRPCPDAGSAARWPVSASTMLYVLCARDKVIALTEAEQKAMRDDLDAWLAAPSAPRQSQAA